METHGFNKVPGSDFNYNIGERYGIGHDQGRKLIKIFNESAAIGFLPPLRDAMYYVKRLHEEHGYVFHCITSLSLDPAAGKLREMNLAKLFGKTAFEKESPSFTAGFLLFGSIIDFVKKMTSSFIGIFAIFFDLLSTITGIPSVVIGIITAIIMIALILLIILKIIV
jgi:hypothetical protein